MSKSHAIINISTDAFLDWITKTNNIIGFINSEAVSANSSGAVTNGTGFVNGIFGANALVASTITGGNSSALGVLVIEANTVECFEYVIVGANVAMNTSALFIGNSIANTIITSSAIIGGPNATLNVVNVETVNAAAIIGVGANVQMNSSGLAVGNSSVFTNITSSAITGFSNAQLNVVNAASVNATTTIGVGANVRANATAWFVGNATANVIITSSAISGGPNATLNVASALIVNAPVIGAGANVRMNVTAISVGNATVNTVITSSAITGSSNATLNVVNAATVNATTTIGVGANARMNTSAFFVGNSTANVVANSTGVTGNNAVFKNATISGGLTIGDSSTNTYINSSAINVTTAYFQTAVIESVEIAEGFAVGVGTFSDRMNVGSNVWINTSTFFIGNSSVNMVINSSGITGSFSLGGDILSANIVNAASLMLVGANVRANATTLAVGNATVFTNITSTAITGFSNAQLNVVNAATVNATTLVGIGANVHANLTAFKVGNATVNTVITSSAISGGPNAALNVVTTSSLNTTALGVGANVRANTTTWFVGNSTANVIISSGSISGGPNATLNVVSIESLTLATALTISELAIGANVSVNSSVIQVGNATVNVSINSSSITGTPNIKAGIINSSTVNATTIVGVGANATINTTAFSIGNATVFTNITSSSITGGANATLNNISVANTVSAISYYAGANAIMTTTGYFIGNATVNTVITSTAITGFSNAQLNVVNAATVNATTLLGVGANISINTTMVSVGNATVFTNITSTAITGFSNAQLNVVNAATVNATTMVGVGANVRMNTTALFVGNATLNVLITSSALTSSINIFANNFSGSNFYADDDFKAANSILDPTGLYLGYSESTNAVITKSDIRLTNSTSNTGLSIPTTVQRAGDYFLHANGSWVEVNPSVPSALTVQTFIANTSIKVGNTSANLSVNSTVMVYANSTVAARFAVYANGNMGVGNATPTQKLTVAGNVYATGELIAASDRAFKEDIESIQNALPMVRKLKGSKYYMKDDEDKNRRKRYGLIAQEVEKVIPELVSGKNGKKGLSYMGLIPILVEAVKELSAQVEELQNDRKSK